MVPAKYHLVNILLLSASGCKLAHAEEMLFLVTAVISRPGSLLALILAILLVFGFLIDVG